MSNQHDIHIEKLEKQVSDLSDALAHLSSYEDFKHLIQILKNPGWTTPAEFIFASAILDTMLAQTTTLTVLKRQLIKGSEAVVEQSINQQLALANHHSIHVERLEKQISDVSDALAHLSSRDDFKHLIQILRNPGWTTPAEFIFASAILDTMLTQTAVLTELKSQLLKGSEAVIAQ